MANNYTQEYSQLIFAVKSREAFLNTKDIKFHEYINGIIRNLECKPIAINNMPDHVHIFVGKSPKISTSELVQRLKNNSSKWLKSHLNNKAFEWQRGYGAFSYGHSQIQTVYKYIANQQIKHHQHTFQEEYLEFLRIFDVDYKSEYLFDFF